MDIGGVVWSPTDAVSQAGSIGVTYVVAISAGSAGPSGHRRVPAGRGLGPITADDPSLLETLHRGYKIRISTKDGSVQLRLEGIDAPELHYEGRSGRPDDERRPPGRDAQPSTSLGDGRCQVGAERWPPARRRSTTAF